MHSSQLTSALKILGLNDFHIELYTYLFNANTKNISKISTYLHTYRSKIYEGIEQLKSYGLLIMLSDGNYKSAPPSRIPILLKEHQKNTNSAIDSINTHLPQLNSHYHFNKEYNLVVHDTQESIQQALYTSETNLNSEIYHYGVSNAWYSYFKEDELFYGYYKKIMDSNSTLRLITFKDNRYIDQYKQSDRINFEVKYLPQEYQKSVSILILPRTVLVFNFDQNITYQIQDVEFRQQQLEFIELIWKSL